LVGAANESLGILTKDIDANALDPNATGTADPRLLPDRHRGHHRHSQHRARPSRSLRPRQMPPLTT
jgi:hypothetical protein